MLDQIDMTFLADLNLEWLETPPLHAIATGMSGYKKPEPKQYMTAEAAMDWFKRTGGKIDGVGQF